MKFKSFFPIDKKHFDRFNEKSHGKQDLEVHRVKLIKLGFLHQKIGKSLLSQSNLNLNGDKSHETSDNCKELKEEIVWSSAQKICTLDL